ncbi:MAG: hypothetical protein KDC13_06915 [Bacteroidetes bacterium]|nr:hypothetical protein [Bacteroidota bacterium]
MVKTLFSCLLLLFLFIELRAQSAAEKLEAIGKEMLESKSEDSRIAAGLHLQKYLDSLTQSGEIFRVEFDSVRSVSAVRPDDNEFLLITWNVPLQSGKVANHGFLVDKEKRSHELNDVKSQISKPEQQRLLRGDWYGVLYYQVKKFRHRKSTYYVLLGYDAADSYTTGKVIDVLSFTKNGEPVFGAPLFSGKRTQKRVLFYYREGASFSLRFDKQGGGILFDHLSPIEAAVSGDAAFMAPDFTVDAFNWKKGRFNYLQNIDARNEGKNEGNQKKPIEKGLRPKN